VKTSNLPERSLTTVQDAFFRARVELLPRARISTRRCGQDRRKTLSDGLTPAP